jgi:hypothetical protein
MSDRPPGSRNEPWLSSADLGARGGPAPAGSAGRGPDGGAVRRRTADPAQLVAAALLVAGVLVLISILVGMATYTSGRLGAGEGFVDRIRFGAAMLDAPLLLLIPVTLLLLQHRPPADRGAEEPLVGLPQVLTVAAAALGAAFALFVLLRLVANQAAGAAEVSARSTALFADLAALVVALAAVVWAVAEARRARERSGPAWEPPPASADQWQAPPAVVAPQPPSDWRPTPADPGWSDRPPIWPHQPPPASPPRPSPVPPVAGPPPPSPPRPDPATPDPHDRPWTPPPL